MTEQNLRYLWKSCCSWTNEHSHTQQSSRDDAEDPQWATSGADRK